MESSLGGGWGGGRETDQVWSIFFDVFFLKSVALFSRPDHLNGHIKQVHTSERPHKCQVGMGPGWSWVEECVAELRALAMGRLLCRQLTDHCFAHTSHSLQCLPLPSFVLDPRAEILFLGYLVLLLSFPVLAFAGFWLVDHTATSVVLVGLTPCWAWLLVSSSFYEL